MDGKGSARTRTERSPSTCFWCKKQFRDTAEKELHVSLLGAPGEFHRACFEEYQQSTG